MLSGLHVKVAVLFVVEDMTERWLGLAFGLLSEDWLLLKTLLESLTMSSDSLFSGAAPNKLFGKGLLLLFAWSEVYD